MSFSGEMTMKLTDDKTYLQLKSNADGLQAKGFEVPYSHLIYIKLAEYERNEEKRQNAYNSIVAENTALRLQLKELTEMNNRMRETIQRQTQDNFVFD